MTTKNVQLKDMEGNLVNPKTLGSIVFNNSNESLGTVEAGAEVNIIESVKVNGTALPISNKEVNVEIAAHKEYSVGTATATEGFLRAWQLTKDGQAIATSTKIDLPKDIVLQEGAVLECTTPDYIGGDSSTGIPCPGAQVGEKYIHLVLANATEDDLFVNVSSLIDEYTQGTGINISNREIAIDNTVATKGNTLAHYGIVDSMTKTEMDSAFGDLTYEELV